MEHDPTMQNQKYQESRESQTHQTHPEFNPQNATASASSLPSPEDLIAKIADLESRLAEMSDAYLRAKAEAENTRRRSEEEVSKTRKFAVESFAESLLPVKDSLEAAIAIHASQGLAQSAKADAEATQVLEGVHATLRQLTSALERHKVLEINPSANTRFDPHQHQAISMVPSTQESNTVVTVLQKGYSIAERILRPALVTVSAPK
jgi:molecular chaperone GrpE